MKFIICLALILGILSPGCVSVGGRFALKGKIIDDVTMSRIPGREVIVDGLLEINDEFEPVYAGQFSTDSSGVFSYKLKRVRGARYYNFHVVGDTNYAATTRRFNFFQLSVNSKRLVIPLRRLAGLTIKIEKLSHTTRQDTLYLSWESDRTNFRNLYPYEIENKGITDIPVMVIPGLGLRWIGGEINATVRTRIYAGKMTKIHWELARNKKRSEFTDTIISKGERVHLVHFTY
ncbi:MAG: hypothetical protein RBS38_04125 [Bacteroidales bacterium]|jgi:hypothetical protein|nr:hypothetical protein [Bacteroidales bacterium]